MPARPPLAMLGPVTTEGEQHGPGDHEPGMADFGKVIAQLPNQELLAGLDLMLLELERRLLRYARLGPELLEMADEGLVLAARAGARLRQAQSSAGHAAGHLQVLGVGEWAPRSTNPAWSDDPRVAPQPDDEDDGAHTD
ncbi:MAG: hypothetical protein QOF04_3644 [Solirubrobacteraceae bacterium]|nr:hypothetical protein [Solirubrobacteraceae bacterium]